MKKITVGIVANEKGTATALTEQINRTPMAEVVGEVSDAGPLTTHKLTQSIIANDPHIIIVNIDDAQTNLQTLQFLHTAAPNARLIVNSATIDPQFMMELMRVGVREFLPSPLSDQNLIQAFNHYISDRVRTSSVQTKASKRGRIYCIASAKQGSGATTLAINLAGIIAGRSKRRTALIDLDRPLGDVAAYLNLKPNFTVSDVLAAGARLDSVLLESYMHPVHGFHVLPGFRELSADGSLSADKLALLFDVAQRTFEHTVVDLPTNLDQEQVKVITRESSTILIILTPELPAIWRTERLLNYLGRIDATDKVRVVLNRATRSDEILDADIERLLRVPLLCKLPNEYGTCIRAINSGVLLETANSKHLNKAIGALATEIARLPEGEGRRGLFGMILKPSLGDTNA